jgi:hypothetical protein
VRRLSLLEGEGKGSFPFDETPDGAARVCCVRVDGVESFQGFVL